MYQVLAILFVLGIASAGPVENSELIRKTCAVQTGASMEAYHNYRVNHIFDKNDYSLKCMQNCILYKYKIVDCDGILDLQSAVDFVMATPAASAFSRGEVWHTLIKCNNDEVEGDACIKAFAFKECIRKVGQVKLKSN